jgi:uncharacterized membrane protein
MYDIALFLHILGVVMLVGALTTTLVATLRSQTARSVGEVRLLTSVTRRIDVVIGPAMLLILADGLYMVSRHGDDGSIKWTSGWVDVAIVVFALMSILGPTIESGHAKRLLQAADALPDGPVPAELDRLLRAAVPVYVSLFGASQILAFLYLMTNKPGFPGAIATCLIAAALSAIASTLCLRMLPPAAAAASTARPASPGVVDLPQAREGDSVPDVAGSPAE